MIRTQYDFSLLSDTFYDETIKNIKKLLMFTGRAVKVRINNDAEFTVLPADAVEIKSRFFNYTLICPQGCTKCCEDAYYIVVDNGVTEDYIKLEINGKAYRVYVVGMDGKGRCKLFRDGKCSLLDKKFYDSKAVAFSKLPIMCAQKKSYRITMRDGVITIDRGHNKCQKKVPLTKDLLMADYMLFLRYRVLYMKLGIDTRIIDEVLGKIEEVYKNMDMWEKYEGGDKDGEKKAGV